MAQKLANKDINLLAVYKIKREPSKYASLIKALAFPGIAAVVFLTIFGVQTYRIHNLKSDTDKINKEVAALQEQMANDPNAEKQAKYIADMATLTQLKQLKEDLESYPELNQNTFDQILLASDVNVDVTSFSYVRESQVITLQIQGIYANDTENFVRRLKTSGLFSKVDYSGYSKVEQTIPTTTTTNTTQNTEDNKTNGTTGKDDASTQALLEALLNIKTNGSTNETQQPQTRTVYTSTVLCTLK